MNAVLRIAHTEMLEHRRQPWMLFILALNYTLLLAVFGTVFALLDSALCDHGEMTPLRQQLAALGVAPEAMTQLLVSSFGALMFTNLPLFVAIMSGYSVLHDRSCGTMPFMMLAPISRRQLLAGKLLGAMAIPVLLHLVFVGVGFGALGQLDVLAPYAERFGASAAWWIAFLVGCPASAAFVGSLGTVVSALSRDVRTSMQFTSFFIGILSLGIGLALADGIPEGVWLQVVVAAGCATAGLLTLLVGARLISRDIAPS